MNDTTDSSTSHMNSGKHLQLIKDQPMRTKTEILNWFFSLSVDERVKAVSITNSALSSLVQKMYMKYSSNSKSKFLIKGQKNDFLTHIDHSIKEDDKLTEKLFINEIRFCSVKTQCDTITLSPQVLNFPNGNSEKKQLFIYYLTTLSRNSLFAPVCQMYYDPKQGACQSDLPQWFAFSTDYYSIGEIVTAHIEQSLSINYLLHARSFGSKGGVNLELREFFEKREALKQYVKEKESSEELIKEISLKEVVMRTLSQRTVVDKQQKKMLRKYFTEMTRSSYALFEPEKSINSEEMYSNFEEMITDKKETAVDDLLFYSLNDLDSFEYHIARELIEVMKVKMDDKNYTDLINECEELSTKKKAVMKKKKKKSRSKRGKEDKENKMKGEVITEANSLSNVSSICTESFIISNSCAMESANDSKQHYDETITKEKEETAHIKFIEDKDKDTTQLSLKEECDDNNTASSIIENDRLNLTDGKKLHAEISTQQIQIESSIQETFINSHTVLKDAFHLKLTGTELAPLKNIYSNGSDLNKEIAIPLIVTPSNLQDKLHNEIILNCSQLHEALSKQKVSQYSSLVNLFEKIKQCFNSDIDISVYGSYSTGLQIESSDIDISIKLLDQAIDNNKIKSILTLHAFLQQFDLFEELYPIITTSVPILRILLNPNKLSAQKTSQSLPHLKIDLTFNLPLCKVTANYVKATLSEHIEIKPILIMFKRLIKRKQLDNVFEGGLSSHSLFLMTTAYINTMKASKVDFNLGQYFLDMLHFYGSIFNYRNTVIDITKANPFIISSDLFSVPLFLDPITHLNVSKSSFGFDKVEVLFREMYSSLSAGKKTLSDVFLE